MKKPKNNLISLIISKTLIFIIVVILISVLKSIFGSENSLLSVTTIVLMLVLSEMNLTMNPVKNLFALIVFNLILGLSSFLAYQNLFAGLILNFVIMAFIGYYFNYELKKPINMIIGLHYILMLSNPVTTAQLPLRLSLLLVGPFMIMAAQLLANKNKLIKSRKKILTIILDNLLLKVELLKSSKDTTEVDNTLTSAINQLKQMIFEGGKTDSHLTECGLNTLNILSCFEKINIILKDTQNTAVESDFLDSIYKVLQDLKDEKSDISVDNLDSKYKDKNLLDALPVYDFINAVKTLNIEIKKYNSSSNNHNTVNNELSISEEFKKLHIQKRLMNIKSTRVSYGIRLGLLVAITFFAFDYFKIQNGEWIIYTVFALSQPHSEYTIAKSKKRIFGTLIGAAIIAILFTLVTDPTLRTLILIVCGYLMSYVSDYKYLVIFITIAAIASAGLNVVNPISFVLARVIYVVIGIILSLLANKLILPRKLSDEENNLNDIQRQSSRKILGEILFNEGSENKSVVGILSLVPSLIDLRISYLKQNGFNMDKYFINENRVLTTDLLQLFILEKEDSNYYKNLSNIKEIFKNSSNLDEAESKIKTVINSANTFEEKYLLVKVSKILMDAHNSINSKDNNTDLYQFLTMFN